MSKLTPEMLVNFPLFLNGYKPGTNTDNFPLYLADLTNLLLSYHTNRMPLPPQEIDPFFIPKIDSENQELKDVMTQFSRIIEFFCFVLNTAEESDEMFAAKKMTEELRNYYQKVSNSLESASELQLVVEVFLAYLESFFNLFTEGVFYLELEKYRQNNWRKDTSTYLTRTAKLTTSLFSDKAHLQGENRFKFFKRVDENKSYILSILQESQLLESRQFLKKSEVRVYLEAVAVLVLQKLGILSEFSAEADADPENEHDLLFILADYFAAELSSVHENSEFEKPYNEKPGKTQPFYKEAPYYLTQNQATGYQSNLLSMFELPMGDLVNLAVGSSFDFLLLTMKESSASGGNEKDSAFNFERFDEAELIALLEIELGSRISILFNEFSFNNLHKVAECLRSIAELSVYRDLNLHHLLRFYPVVLYIFQRSSNLTLPAEVKEKNKQLAEKETRAYHFARYSLSKVKEMLEKS